jgi:hypothetical protein
MAGTAISKASSPVARTALVTRPFSIEEEAVAGHAGHDLFVGIDFANGRTAGYRVYLL